MNSEMLKESGEQENIGGASLGKLVARIESYPFSDQDRFGAVFNGEDEIVAGFRPENLVKGLKRWNAQLKDGKDLPIDKLYKNRLELAAIEASFKMAGQLDPRVGSKIRERAQELRQIIGKGKLIERGSLPEFPTAKIDFQSKKVPKLTKVEVLKNQATLVKRRVGEARERLAPFRGLDSFREVAGKLSESYRLGGDFFEQRNIQARSTEDQSLLQVATWLRTNSLRKGQLPRMERVRVVGKSGRVVEFDPNLTRSPKDSKEAVTISEAVLGLAEMRAKLEVISANVPDAYAGLQMGVRRTMKLVDNATLNLVDGKLGLSGRFSLEQVLRTSAERKRRDLRMKTTEGVLILALAACAVPGVGTSTPVSPEVTPVKTEQVLVRSSIENAEIDSSIAESRAIENPTAEDIENLEKLLNLRKGLEQITNAVPGWESVAPEQMQFAIMTVYDASGRVTGGFELVKNIETKEQMVLSVGEKVEEDETVLRKYVNLPLYERFTIDSEGRFVNGDWYYVDAEGNKHSLYKTNEEGKLGGVPIEGEIIWSEQVLGYQPINTLETAKLAKIALPPGDLTGLTIDTELGLITDSEGNVIFVKKDGEWAEPQVDLTSLVEPGQEIREVNGYQAVGSEYSEGFPEYEGYSMLQKNEFRMKMIQGEGGTFRVLNGQAEKFQGGQWQTMDWPTNIREIAFFDIKDHDGNGKQEIYAIDEYGLAVAELKDGKWEKYVRQMRGLDEILEDKDDPFIQSYNEMLERLRADKDVTTEVDVSEIKPIIGPKGEPLDWDGWWRQCSYKTECSIGEGGPRVEGESGFVYMPAVIKGIYPGYQDDFLEVVFEMPRRYYREMITMTLGNKPEYTNFNYYQVLGEGNDWEHRKNLRIGNVDMKQAAWIRRVLENGGRAMQIVLPLVARTLDWEVQDEAKYRGIEEMEKLMQDQGIRSKDISWSVFQMIVPFEMGELVE